MQVLRALGVISWVLCTGCPETWGIHGTMDQAMEKDIARRGRNQEMPFGVSVMNWKAVASALLLLALPLPLMGLWLVATRVAVPRAGDPRLVPMLEDWKRRQMLTYWIDCQRHEDCAAPLKCFADPMNGQSSCMDSRCMEDKDCPTGLACRTFASSDERVLVRECVALGVRQEGEPCQPIPKTQQRGCVAGLLCQHEWCGRPCVLNDRTSCSQGFFCAKGPDGPSCLPSCEERGCPPGRECFRYQAGSSICAEVHGQNCEQTPCPEGQFCHAEEISHQADAVWMSCRTRCDGRHPCPGDKVCFNLLCRQACALEGPDTCGPHRRCGRRRQEAPWCVPDL